MRIPSSQGSVGTSPRDPFFNRPRSSPSTGQVGAHAGSYVVKAGDNIFVIAKKFGQTQRKAFELLGANPAMPAVNRAFGRDFARLSVGTVLTIPASWRGGRVNGPGSGSVGDVICPDGTQRDFDTWECVPIPGGGWSGGNPDGSCKPGGYAQTFPGCADGYTYSKVSGAFSGCCNPIDPGTGVAQKTCNDFGAVPGDFCPDPGNPLGPQTMYDGNCNCVPICSAGNVYDSAAGGCVAKGTATQPGSANVVDCAALTGRDDCWNDPGAPGGCACPGEELPDHNCKDPAGGKWFVECPPNSVVNATDCGCDCVAGTVFDGTNCVPKDSGVTPQPQPIDGGQPVGPTPITQTQPASTSSDDSSVGKVLLGLAVAGAIGYGAYTIAKKRLRGFENKENRS